MSGFEIPSGDFLRGLGSQQVRQFSDLVAPQGERDGLKIGSKDGLGPKEGPAIGPSDGIGEGQFSDALASALEEVSDLQNEVKVKAESLARGEPVELHDLMISMGKSDVAFNLMLEVRNKLLEAWDTISRSSV